MPTLQNTISTLLQQDTALFFQDTSYQVFYFRIPEMEIVQLKGKC